MRKVFLDELPRKMHGKKECIDWEKCIGLKVKFIYDDVIGELKILNKLSNCVIIDYKDKLYKMKPYNFTNSKFAYMLDKVTKEFKININKNIKDGKRDITITNREIRRVFRDKTGHYTDKKYYKFTCNKCGWMKGWIEEYNLLNGCGCACCSGRVVVEGINDIPTTAPWMIKYFQGGYEEAKLYSHGLDKRIYPICPDCGKIKQSSLSIKDIYRSKSIGCNCSDGISYPEKFISNMICQLNIKYINQATKKILPWINNGIRYDFYIKDKYIIETHGNQHYVDKFYKGRDIKSIIENDKFKERLAKENGIKHYIVLDCRKSELEWIKNSVIESELPSLFNFTEDDVDWLKCHEFALKNIVKEVCRYKKSHSNEKVSSLSDRFKIEESTVRKYLKKGKILGWC